MRDSSDSTNGPRPSRRRVPAWAILLIGIATTVVVAFIVGAIVVVNAIAQPFSPPNVSNAVSHVRSMPCVTWARASTLGGGFDVSPSAIIQIGLRPDCSPAHVTATYASVYGDTTAVRKSDYFRVEYLVSATPPKTAPNPNALTKSTVAQLTMDRSYNLPRPAAFARTVVDWMAVRDLVDPGAQLELLDDDFSRTEERYTANSTAAELRMLSSSLPERLRSQAWKVTIQIGRAHV